MSIDIARLMGRWIRVSIQDKPFVGYVYLDQNAGPSAKGGFEIAPDLAERPSVTLRLSGSPLGSIHALDATEVEQLGLPSSPTWLHFFGPQPNANAPWRQDPMLLGKFHPTFPDDLQVLVHDGEPRRTRKQPEVCWVRVVAAEPGLERAVYVGTLLNAPHHLITLKQGDRMRFWPCKGSDFPLLVTEQYVAERPKWRITPCDKCGLAETLDPPSVMARLRFPDAPAGAEISMFTSFCPKCGGVQGLERV